MYTYNLFIFGHELAKDPDLNNLLNEEEFEFECFEIEEMCFYFDWPYHGGQVRGDLQSCCFGTCLSDDHYDKANFLKFVSTAQEETYRANYEKWLVWLRPQILSFCASYKGEEREKLESLANRLFKFLEENEPCFYMIEVSS